jgi:MinD-like ATPase involved in chromosome partitioning or flagellar assembly
MSKTVLTSGTGGTGKTTLMAQFFYERLGRPPLFAVETQNETADMYGLQVQKYSSERWLSFQRQALMVDDLLVEIGSGHTEDSYASLMRLDDAHEEYDYFIVPAIPTAKSLQESASTINALASLGIEPRRIRLLFNRVVHRVEDEFHPLLSYVHKQKNCIANPAAAVYQNEIFDMLHDFHLTIDALLADDRDFRSLARSKDPEVNQKLRSQYATLHLMRGLARGIQPKLDKAFEALFA